MTGRTGTRGLEAVFSARLFLATAVAMVFAAALSVIYTLTEFSSQLRPLLVAKTETIAQKVDRDIEYALAIGVPFSELRGIDEFLETLNSQHPEVNGLSVSAGAAPNNSMQTGAELDEGRLVEGFFQRILIVARVLAGDAGESPAIHTDIALPSGQVVGHVTAHVDEDYVLKQMQSVFFDTLVTLIAVALVALEVIVVLAGFLLAEPLRRIEIAVDERANGSLRQYQGWSHYGELGRFIGFLNSTNAEIRDRVRALLESAKDKTSAALMRLQEIYALEGVAPKRGASIIDARIPLFVFSVAEELQKSFLPLFVGEYYQQTDLFDRSIMVGLPISCFMFVIAFITPFAGSFVDRFGARLLFLIGIVPAIGGYLLCYMAQSGNDIVIARSITAVGYAVIVISSQSYVAATLTSANRARGMAIFVGVLMAGTMCGTAIGAILADWLGYKPVFLVSILLACVAGALGFMMLAPEVEAAGEGKRATRQSSGLGGLLMNSRFVMIVLFCAIPAKIVLTGFLYLFVPIYLASLEATQSEIGRIMMVYSLIIIPISPLASRFADRMGNNLRLVIVATVASGVILIGLYQSETVARILLVVAALGVAHAFIKAPLIVAAMEAATSNPDVSRTDALAVLRTAERVGSVIGPVVVAALMVVLDYNTTAVLLGAAISLAGLTMAALTYGRGGDARPQEDTNA